MAHHPSPQECHLLLPKAAAHPPCVSTEHSWLPFWTETFLSLSRGEAAPTCLNFLEKCQSEEPPQVMAGGIPVPGVWEHGWLC